MRHARPVSGICPICKEIIPEDYQRETCRPCRNKQERDWKKKNKNKVKAKRKYEIDTLHSTFVKHRIYTDFQRNNLPVFSRNIPDELVAVKTFQLLLCREIRRQADGKKSISN